ncbi:MAG TPA: DUF2939 domain-containing protein [Xanthobacteraceae bacterium]|nr:DUF2939 domain-containing protein [Xanthobacteraceae bacterium]
MKWAGAILGVMLYLAWPYYTLVELAQAIKSSDAPAINKLVDWSLVRTSLKAQFQAHLDNMPKTAAEQQNPAAAMFGNTLALTLANTLIDKMLTPQGITLLIEGARAAKTSKEARPVASQSAPVAPKQNLYQRVKFAFFVSPIHFQLDLDAPDQSPMAVSAPAADKTVTLMLMFKGTGWQVSDVRFPRQNFSPKMAQVSR